MSKIIQSSASKVASLLRPEAINLNIQSAEKPAALREVAELLRATNCITDFDSFFREILERERVSNTALGHDVAIPHARTEQCKEILIAIGRSTTGINFEAKDSQLVHLVFLIGTPKTMVTDYLRVVGNLARILRHDQVRADLINAPDAASFIKIIAAAEA